MIFEILNRTPSWVFGLFVLLLGLGYWQSRPRRMRRTALWIFPVAMALFSIYSTTSSFGTAGGVVPAWAAGFAMAFLRGVLRKSFVQASFDLVSQRFTIEGSWTPLALLMAIFFTNYAISVAKARMPSIVHDTSFMMLACVTCGAFSGMLLARAAVVWRCQARDRS